jgi:hypothetical protein
MALLGHGSFPHPEERFALCAETDSGAIARLLGRDLHNHADAERPQRLEIERGGAGQIADGHADMVDHVGPLMRYRHAT